MQIKEYLQRNHLTVKEFAVLIGLSPSRVYHLIGGDKPTLIHARKIEKITKGQVTVKELMKYDWE